MQKYFVYDVNMMSLNSILPFTEDDVADEVQKAHAEFGDTVIYLQSKELFKTLKVGKKKERGAEAEIILSPVLQQYIETFRLEFPKAIVWVYDEGITKAGPKGPMSVWGNQS
ncbi:hypothetical protein ACFO26_05020 [Lactococcus nasutitermitis]|uniref:Uncharacterized protein n=1 Tax=Lactococcus nasutitermitis TaxID=1652957 RepID=A0ABV9JG21_9LACT|nr:hypothetical protein [Lactococcus nasutitermitis]